MTNQPVSISPEVLDSVARGEYHSPHSVLGGHPEDGTVTVRTVRHLADEVTVVTADAEYPASHEHNGVWVAVLPGDTVPDYRLRIRYGDTTTNTRKSC